MFDKYLCKHIHKKEISALDLINYAISVIIGIAIICFVLFLLCTVTGIAVLSVVNDAYLTEEVSLSGTLKETLVGFCTIISFVLFVKVITVIFDYTVNKLSKIKIATCPNAKPESKEPSQDQLNEDRNPNCSFSNVCELGKTCTNCYNDCLKTNHKK